MANNFYKALFSNDENEMHWQPTDISFPRLSDDEVQQISVEIDEEEIKQAVFSMSPWKASGPDGFPAGFYQKSWNVV
ncbi:retrotransposon protein putative unclassified, partial [Trifolium medium]|nr:retrotransposon protein putative unclassified [Trifolium medium]